MQSGREKGTEEGGGTRRIKKVKGKREQKAGERSGIKRGRVQAERERQKGIEWEREKWKGEGALIEGERRRKAEIIRDGHAFFSKGRHKNGRMDSGVRRRKKRRKEKRGKAKGRKNVKKKGAQKKEG